MSFLDDVTDLVAGEITHIGLSTDGTSEYSGTGYSHQAPTYGAADGNTADLTGPLEFDGGANDGPVTHLVFKRSGSPWVFRAVDSPQSFNSDGKLAVSSAPVSAAFPA